MLNHPENDLLSLVLSTSRLNTHIFFYDRLCDSWAINTSGSNRATFHLVGEGVGWLHLKTQVEPILLCSGDLVLFPHDAWHEICDNPHVGSQSFTDDLSQLFMTLMCGYFMFESGPRNLVIDALPDMVLVRSKSNEETEQLEALVKLLLAEAQGQSIGNRVALDSLGNVLLVHAVRHYLKEERNLTGFFAGITQPKILLALQAIHGNPGKGWTVDALAEIAMMSRANFAQHFTFLIGQSPMAYVTEWRMKQAELMMRDRSISVTEIAQRFGYSSEAAFRRAFKRIWGVGPGLVRKFKSQA